MRKIMKKNLVNEFSNVLQKKNLKLQNIHQLKNRCCKKNDITLYRIPYYFTNKEVQQVLDQIINKFNDYPEKEQELSNSETVLILLKDKDIVSSLGKLRAI